MAENDDGICDGNRRLRLLPNRCGSFTGSTLCKMLGNGIYRFPFPVYRETAKYGSNISMANNGFEHPCVLSVRNGVGMLQLKAADKRKKWMAGTVGMAVIAAVLAGIMVLLVR